MKTLALGLTYKHTASTKRAAEVNGIVGPPSTHLEDLRVSYPIPVDPSGLTGLRETNVIQTLTEVYWIFVNGVHDIATGDRIVVDGTEYIIRLDQPQPTPAVMAKGAYTRLTVERIVK